MEVTMRPLRYHAGQLAVQAEANTTHVADKLAGWVGPVERYAVGADLIVLAVTASDGTLAHVAVSGDPPLADPEAPGVLRIPDAAAAVILATGAASASGSTAAGVAVGGLVISLARAERARINGTVLRDEDGGALAIDERFTLCRKYLAPSIPVGSGLHVGPAAVAPIEIDDPWVARVLAAAETAFLASRSPDGAPDVAHRGGPPGFLVLEATTATVSWTEFVGDGVFKSAGNVRATGIATLLVPDLASGDAVELEGSAAYTNVLTRFLPREDALVQHSERFPTQGRMVLTVRSARRLRSVIAPRRRIDGDTVTSRDHPEEQAPR
jgi:hypothetical protein